MADKYIVKSHTTSVVNKDKKEPSNVKLFLGFGIPYQQSEIISAIETVNKFISDEFVEVRVKFLNTNGATWLAIYKKGELLAELGAHSDEELSEKADNIKKLYSVNHYTLIEIELEVV